MNLLAAVFIAPFAVAVTICDIMPIVTLPEFNPRPVTLTGTVAQLEPLSFDHAQELFQAGSDESVWTWMPNEPFTSIVSAQRFIEAGLAETESGRAVVFAIRERKRDVVVGSTRFLTIRREHRGLEIGFTWLSPAAQRTAINTECKLLLLSHAFEDLGALRVELKTDELNKRSQIAIERIGAQREGVHRAHMLVRDGRIRDSVYYGITREDWPGVRDRLLSMLSR